MSFLGKTLLVLGGTGYLARALLEDISAFGWKGIYVTYHRTPPLQLKAPLHWLAVQDILRDDLEPFDVILNLAGCYTGPSEVIWESNLHFPARVAEHLMASGGVFINTGTAMPQEVSEYAASKWALVDFLKKSAKNTVNIELQLFFGPGDNSIISRTVRALLDDKFPVKMTHGLQVRDIIYIDDVSSAYLYILFNTVTQQVQKFHSIELGTGNEHSIRSVVNCICNQMGEDIDKFLFGALPLREHEPERLVASTPRSSFLSNWAPKYSLESAISKLIEYERCLRASRSSEASI